MIKLIVMVGKNLQIVESYIKNAYIFDNNNIIIILIIKLIIMKYNIT